MGLGDRLKDITRKAQDSAAEHTQQIVEKAQATTAERHDQLHGAVEQVQSAAAEHKRQIHGAVEKAQAAADRRTGGQYHEQILQAAARVESYVDGLQPPDRDTRASDEPASSESPRR